MLSFYKFNRRASLRGTAGVCCVFVLCSVFFQTVSGRAGAVTQGPMQLGCLQPGVSIYYLHSGTAVPDIVNRNLVLTVQHRRVLLTSFRQLFRHVSIESEEQALDYVRFHDSLYTFYYWHDPVLFEVLSDQKAASLPSYGLDKYYEAYRGGAGDAGVISGAAYKMGRFIGPTVSQVGDHFEIVRWVFVPPTRHTPATVRQIREYVKPDGSYRWVTIQRMRTPKLPDTYWRVPFVE